MALRDTVQRLRDARDAPDDPEALVARWRSAIDALYAEIADWLKPFVDEGGISLQRHIKSVHEEATGPYDIDQLDIDIGDETVRLDPRGTIVIGARGRIDMSRLGSGDPLFLILTGLDDRPAWSLVEPVARMRMTPLTKEVFEEALERLLAEYGLRSEFGI